MPKSKTELASINKTKVKDAVNAFLEGVFIELNAGGRVAIKRFGSLHAQERQPRAGRNPKTGKAIDIPTKRAVKLRASKKLQATELL